MKKDPFITLLSEKLSGEISSDGQHELDEMLHKNEAYRQLAARLEQYFKHQATAVSETKTDPIWSRIAFAENNRSNKKIDDNGSSRPVFYRWLFRIAAVVMLVMSIGMISYFLTQQKNKSFNEFTAGSNKIFKVLNDGTAIWLNKKSSLRYNEDFGLYKREIFLKGEAYFDVVKNTGVPLIIHVGEADIEVKGTAFNVNAYQENEHIEIALIRGSIVVTSRQPGRKAIMLRPNDKLTLSNKADDALSHFQLIALSTDKLLLETRWAADTLTFNKERLDALALRMEKKYDLKIEIHSERLKEKRFSGTFIHESIDQALAALKLSYPLTYTIQNRLVILKEQE